jgi:hypothetical protein
MIDRLCAEALARGGKLLYQWLTQSLEGLNRPLMHPDAVPGISSAARDRVLAGRAKPKLMQAFLKKQRRRAQKPRGGSPGA